ncbi:hypothetical protein ACFY2Y_10490 [Janibacter hoylei]|uniref:hypothetical protein n=1 Tax=Janibacter hoylei TaxID=364298 RepID=UPI0036AC915A
MDPGDTTERTAGEVGAGLLPTKKAGALPKSLLVVWARCRSRLRLDAASTSVVVRWLWIARRARR